MKSVDFYFLFWLDKIALIQNPNSDTNIYRRKTVASPNRYIVYLLKFSYLQIASKSGESAPKSEWKLTLSNKILLKVFCKWDDLLIYNVSFDENCILIQLV